MKADNHSNEANDQLDELLKGMDLQEPSAQFVDRVIHAYATQKGYRGFRLLRVPLFLMGGLGLLLLLPWILSMAETIPNDPNPQLLRLVQELSVDLSIWYFVCPLALLLSLVAVALIEMRSITLPKTNRPSA